MYTYNAYGEGMARGMVIYIDHAFDLEIHKFTIGKGTVSMNLLEFT